MNHSDYTLEAPGQLVPTSVTEEYVVRGVRESRQREVHAFVPDKLPPRRITATDLTALMQPILEAERAVARLDGLSRRFSNPWLVVHPLMRREAETSSRIENTIATAEEVALYQAGYGAARADTVEVANYLEALQYGVSSSLPISRRLICEMHRRLLQGARGQNSRPGEIRTIQNRIGGTIEDARSARFVPPPAGELLEQGIKDFELFVNAPPPEMSPMVAVALAHYQFEALHPFHDGNGRVGRAIAALTLCKMGLLSYPLVYVSGYFDRHRGEYYDLLLRVSTHGDWESWLRFFLAAISDQARDAGGRIDRLLRLYEDQGALLRRGQGVANSLALLDHLFDSPAVTASSAQHALHTSNPTARAAIGRLERSGMLTELTDLGLDTVKVWVARPILDIINAEFGSESDSSGDDRHESRGMQD